GIVLVARSAEQRGKARGCHQPAELVAGLRAFRHVPCRDLEDVEHTVKVGGEHAAPFFLGAVDEGPSPAAADAGIGKAAVDAAEGMERRLPAVLSGGRGGAVADRGLHLAGAARWGRGRRFVLFGVAAPDRDVAPTARKGLRGPRANSAITAGDDGHTAGK